MTNVQSSTDWRSHRTPPPPHPFAYSIANADWILVSGTVGLSPSFEIPDSAADQARYALQEVQRQLEQEGSGLSDIVWFKPYVTDRAYLAEVDAVINEFLPDPRPAGGAMTIVGLVDESLKVEFEVWAYRGARIVAAE